jgi:exodeoxyribonuclease V beta subunit
MKLDAARLPLRGTQLIEASAGTGKTWTISTLFLRFVVEERLTVDQILVVTFTRAATAELKERVRGRLADALRAVEQGQAEEPVLHALVQRWDRRAAREALEAALHAFDTAAINTIHGYCQRALTEHAFESGVPLRTKLITDERPLRQRVAADLWVRETFAADPALVRHLRDGKRGALGPTVLGRLLDRAATHPELVVIPAPQPSSLDEAAVGLRAAWAEAAAAWGVARAPLLQLLLTSPALNRSSYKQATLELVAEALDQAFAGEPDPSALPDRLELLTPTRLQAGTKKGQATPAHPCFERLAALLTAVAAYQRDLEQETLNLLLRSLHRGGAELRAHKDSEALWSFDDLLQHLDRALAGPDGEALAARLRERQPVALIDEFQDTDPVQYRIFRRLYHDRPSGALLLIGDPKQAIYAFRGADIFAYLRAADDARAHTWTLPVNRRSDPGLVTAVNGLFSRSAQPFLYPGIRFEPVLARPGADDLLRDAAGALLPGLELTFLRRDGRTGKINNQINRGIAEADLPGLVAADIVALLESGATLGGHPIEPGQIAVLVRRKVEATAMQEALRALGVPSVLTTEASVLDSVEAGELSLILAAMAEPRRAPLVRAALATPAFGLDAAALAALRADEAAWDRQVDRFQRWGQAWREHGFLQAFRRLVDETGAPARAAALPDGERRLTNTLHLAELLDAVRLSRKLSPEALCRWLDEARAAQDHERDEEATGASQLRLESDTRAVQLVTMHKSKGLEYPIVYCPFLWAGSELHARDKRFLLFHDPDADHRLTLDLGSPDHGAHAALAAEENLAEQLRLLYVALTRARHRCVIAWGAISGAGSSALSALLHAGGSELHAAPERFKHLDDEGLLADLRAYVASVAPHAALRSLEEPTGLRWRGLDRLVPRLSARPITRDLREPWRASSFSNLIADRPEEGPEAPAAQGTPEALAAEGERPADHDEGTARLEDTPEPEGPPIPLDSFPKGASVGHLLHGILEDLDFQYAARPEGPEAARRLVEGRLEAARLDALRWTGPLLDMIAVLLDTPLSVGGPRLGRVSHPERRAEMEFILPVAQAKERRFTPERLAALFRASAREPVPPGYADELGQLGFLPLQGWLRGFIDLVFTAGGRWYVLDWKSNHLGPRPEDYASAGLIDAMAHHHYFLQYHLYLVALHRHLRLRLPDYDYDRHIGGAYYVFLRGLGPVPGQGVLFDRPPKRLIVGLSDLLEEG